MTRQKTKTRRDKTRRKTETRQDDVSEVITGFARGVNSVFELFTGKSIAAWFQEFRQPARKLPPGDQVTSVESEMPLADAYAILGLKPDATIEQVKEHYRNLAKCFHSDRSGMSDEAMKLLNRAYERITKWKAP